MSFTSARRRGIRWSITERRMLATVGLVAAMATGCGADNRSPGASGAGSTSAVGTYVMAASFPVSSADWAAGQQFGAFQLSVEDKEIDACMQADGLPAPPPIMNEFTPDNIEFPDLETIAQKGFASSAITNPQDPTSGMTTAERRAYQAADQRCASKAQHPFAAINAMGAALKNEWSDIVTKIDATPAMQSALRQFRACTTKAGDGSSTIEGFLGSVDQRTVPLYLKRQDAVAAAVERQLGQVFARCLGPAQALRIKLRQQQHAIFFASHADQIKSFQEQADAIVSQLEHRYGLGIPHTIAVQS